MGQPIKTATQFVRKNVNMFPKWRFGLKNWAVDTAKVCVLELSKDSNKNPNRMHDG